MKKFFYNCETCDTSFKIVLKKSRQGSKYCFFCGDEIDDVYSTDILTNEHEIELQDQDEGYDELDFDEV